MAITRCPYCRAIIDEKDQFCTNCGTQLLFPEDEAVEEDIPGDRIIDVADDDKDYEIPPPGIDEDEEEDDGGSATQDDLEEEVIIIDEIEEAVRRAASGDMEKRAEEAPDVKESPKEPRHEERPSEEPPEQKAAEEEPGEETIGEESVTSPETKIPAKPATASRPLTFDTRELEKSGGTAADLGKQEIDRWLENRRGRERQEAGSIVNRRKTDDDLPPWAGHIKDALSEEKDESDTPDPAASDPDEGARVERPSISPDSGIGLPERLTQSDLPFADSGDSEEELPWKEGEGDEVPSDWLMDRAMDERDELEEPEDAEESDGASRPSRIFRISIFLKSKTFDLLLMAVIWFVSILIAARLLETTVFRLFPVVAKALLAYYAILTLLYFFLFHFFLGETFGDRMFRQRNAE